MTQRIQYLRRREIDTMKWDKCIDDAENGLIYSYSWYLDNMAAHWDALVLNDYEAVMPLTWRKKYGIRYLYQPPFCQQLGITGRKASYQNEIHHFLSLAQKHFRFIEIFLNFDNAYTGTIARNNFILSLAANYEELYANFKNDLKSDISKARNNNGINYTALTDYKMIIRLYKAQYGKRFAHVGNEDYRRLGNLCRHLQQNEGLVMRGSFAGEKPLALSLLLNRNNRLYLLISVTPPEGRQLYANHLHMSETIKEFSNRHLILDLEGSDLPGVAHFYKSFGCINQPYYYLRCNNLPFAIKCLKA